MARACGQQAVNAILADGTMPIESVPFSSSTSSPFLCRGALFTDNPSLLQCFTPDQKIPFEASSPSRTRGIRDSAERWGSVEGV
ncbi:hypothetical protein B0H65DRAFT_549897 [Neurospora tetraspora]|uniref:Uncharacterized protein n=1 Tax=Neurospora tetraspora TaxID=94610 RepID=A0AAE0JCL3_9PEZI|nr:hypothetical protein B0H65DRAFT_549897 [Neurospora tetraspora]